MALDIRQEKFVKEYVLGKSAAEAARLAGYEPSYARKAATHLLGNHEVSVAIGEARARIRNETLIEAKDLFDKLEAALAQATEAKQFTAVARLLELQGKLAGLLIERQAHLHDVGPDLRAAIEAANARVTGAIAPMIEGRARNIDPCPAPAYLTSSGADDIFEA